MPKKSPLSHPFNRFAFYTRQPWVHRIGQHHGNPARRRIVEELLEMIRESNQPVLQVTPVEMDLKGRRGGRFLLQKMKRQ